MIVTQEQRSSCAQKLLAGADRASHFTAFLGLDGFVDEILHVVDTRQDAEHYTRLARMEQWGKRIIDAANKSTNIELVTQTIKLGGNGPIMANALSSFGLKVSYLGILGYPNIHPVFQEFCKKAEVWSIAEPGYTYAVEFENGKVMLGKHQSLKEMRWENILTRFGREKFAAKFTSADLVGFLNWTMLTYMSQIWEAVLKEICPNMVQKRRTLFIDLADPEKRTPQDIRHALDLIAQFQQYFDVTLGLNQKEAIEVGGRALGLDVTDQSPEGLSKLACEIQTRVPVDTVIIHPVPYALAVSKGKVSITPGPVTDKPLITTGAGDHFNAGFCIGKLLGLDNLDCLLSGVTCSGFYVRTAKSPTIRELAQMLQDATVQY
ncbi:MAG: carbohydrate kinase family protein [Verrucomicrobiae bacterium]|nr:carbohydrate kinase family protein [Verrucomicrobiae bacterium]